MGIQRLGLMFGCDGALDDWVEEFEFLHVDQKTPIPVQELPAVAAMQGESLNNVEIYIRRLGKPEGRFVNIYGPSIDC